MLAVLVNSLAIAVGSLLGLWLKHLVTERISKVLEIALGFCTIAIGIKMVLKYEYILVLITCTVLGAIIGTALRLEERVNKLGGWIQGRMKGRGGEKFVAGFASASIIFCVGAMAVIGGIQAGISHDYEIYFAKSILDGIFSMTLGALYGIGVAFSAFSVFAYQGSITLAAPLLHGLTAPRVLSEITGVGGVLLLMIGVHVSGIKKLPLGDFLPSSLLVIFFCLIFAETLYL